MEPITNYEWVVRDGLHLYLAGHGPFISGVPQYRGKVGRDLTVEEGYAANRLVGLTILRTLKDELGSLEFVERPLWQQNFVNVSGELQSDYYEVGNGSTDLWSQLWGDQVARCARITIGVTELPEGVPTAIISLWKARGSRDG